MIVEAVGKVAEGSRMMKKDIIVKKYSLLKVSNLQEPKRYKF